MGIDGVNGTGFDARKTLEQVGTQAECVSGRVRMFAWQEVLPAEPLSVSIASMSVHADDRIWARVRYAKGVFELRIHNLTRKTSYHISKAVSAAARQTAEWVVEAPSRGCPDACKVQLLAPFGQVTVTDSFVTAGSLTGTIVGDSWGVLSLDMLRAGIQRASTGVLLNDATSFAVDWVHL